MKNIGINNSESKMKIMRCCCLLLCVCCILSYAQGENWVYRYDGPASLGDGAHAIVYGADGNIYTAGWSVGIGTEEDITVISLTTAGDTNWVYRYNGSSNGGDVAYALVYGMDGNIYVAGSSMQDVQGCFTVISLTTAGDTRWVYYHNFMPGWGWFFADDIIYGADGNIYVAVNCLEWCVMTDGYVISFTTAGDTNWVAGDGRWVNSIVYGADDNIYTAGYVGPEVITPDMAVSSLTLSGNINWIYIYDGPAYSADVANSLVYGADGNIYAAGYSQGIDTYDDFTVISLTTAGDTNWVYRYDGPGNAMDRANSIVYGTDGNIYAAGGSTGNGTDFDFIVISLTTTGDPNWIYRYDGSASGFDEARSIIYGLDGNIYAAGCVDDNFVVISLTAGGDTNWVYKYNGAGDNTDNARSIAYGADGNVYAAGYSEGIGTYSDFTVISLLPDLGVSEQKTRIVNNRLNATIFAGPIVLPADKSCRVYDITGRVVEPSSVTRGIYFIEVDGAVTQKVIKIK
jgi:uncharacterized delta-60 repeat protein